MKTPFSSDVKLFVRSLYHRNTVHLGIAAVWMSHLPRRTSNSPQGAGVENERDTYRKTTPPDCRLPCHLLSFVLCLFARTLSHRVSILCPPSTDFVASETTIHCALLSLFVLFCTFLVYTACCVLCPPIYIHDPHPQRMSA